MEYCKKCLFYDADYDDLHQSGDDTIVESEEVTEKHYCRMYESHIDPDIVIGKKSCKHYFKK